MLHEQGQALHFFSLAGHEHGHDDVVVLQQLDHELIPLAVSTPQLAGFEGQFQLRGMELAVLILDILGDLSVVNGDGHEVVAELLSQLLLSEIHPAEEGNIQSPFAVEDVFGDRRVLILHDREGHVLKDGGLHIGQGGAGSAQQEQGHQDCYDFLHGLHSPSYFLSDVSIRSGLRPSLVVTQEQPEMAAETGE